jgi:hypothetical protein
MNVFHRILFVVIAVCIPVVSLFSALNIVFRLPDLYVYEFNKNQLSTRSIWGLRMMNWGVSFLIL